MDVTMPGFMQQDFLPVQCQSRQDRSRPLRRWKVRGLRPFPGDRLSRAASPTATVPVERVEESRHHPAPQALPLTRAPGLELTSPARCCTFHHQPSPLPTGLDREFGCDGDRVPGAPDPERAAAHRFPEEGADGAAP